MRHSDAKSRHVSGALRQRALPIMDTATPVENGFPKVPLCFNDYTDISRLLLIDALRWRLRGGGALLCSGPRRHQGQRHGSSQPGASPQERRFQSYAALKGRDNGAVSDVSPLQGWSSVAQSPRALPWAGIAQAFGLKGRTAQGTVRTPSSLAPKGRDNSAQGNALGKESKRIQALKGRDTGAVSDVSPLQGSRVLGRYPVRCPGLGWIAPVGAFGGRASHLAGVSVVQWGHRVGLVRRAADQVGLRCGSGAL